MIQQPAKFIMAAICLSASMPPFVHAETILFRATSDFPVIDVGEVPYYSEEPVRSSLAINAANESFREKFARATTVYEGESRFFDITLTGLAELDGEAMYRVLINDVLIGEATNPTTDTDYTEVRHTFESVVVPAGATIAVESLANTNGLIPEGDGTALLAVDGHHSNSLARILTTVLTWMLIYRLLSALRPHPLTWAIP